ncbi:MAG: hypothetical protein IT449_09455 [Phycisphaerales bacterium]|nr:hypothetical protein [Phycisphaerales bacterium]
MGDYMPRDFIASEKRTFLGTLFYEPIAGSLHGSPTESDAGVLMKRSGTASQARLRVILSGIVGETSKVSLIKNGQTTGISFEVLGATSNDHQLFETSSTVIATFSADDKLYWKIEPKSDIGGRWLSIRSIALRIE